MSTVTLSVYLKDVFPSKIPYFIFLIKSNNQYFIQCYFLDGLDLDKDDFITREAFETVWQKKK